MSNAVTARKKNPKRLERDGPADLASGAAAQPGPKRRGFRWVTCPDCAEKRYAFAFKKSRSGRCAPCANRRRRKRTGVEERTIETRYHGTKRVKINWDRRPDCYHATFECWYCGKEHTAQIVVMEKPTWEGLSWECKRLAELDERTLASGAKFKPDPNKTNYGWVTCPGPGNGLP
jgi:hypothetical protein